MLRTKQSFDEWRWLEDDNGDDEVGGASIGGGEREIELFQDNMQQRRPNCTRFISRSTHQNHSVLARNQGNVICHTAG